MTQVQYIRCRAGHAPTTATACSYSVPHVDVRNFNARAANEMCTGGVGRSRFGHARVTVVCMALIVVKSGEHFEEQTLPALAAAYSMWRRFQRHATQRPSPNGWTVNICSAVISISAMPK